MGLGLLDRLRKNRPKPLLNLIGRGQRKGLHEILTERRNRRLGIVSDDDNPEDPTPEPAGATTTTEASKDVDIPPSEIPSIEPEETKPLPEKETATEAPEKEVTLPPDPPHPEPKKSEEEKKTTENPKLTVDELLENVSPEKRPQVMRSMKRWIDNFKKSGDKPETRKKYRKGISEYYELEEDQVDDDKYVDGTKDFYD